ncbi:Subunit F of the V1 peripheral membrane domain of V-ATPase [Malassezia sympodialis ATCC 42132]|uniref:V-type proton ATPase subunit F n=1 Tax=Malassezia sympodialis (strain ATCC 42132) TaxID=1230383 RepID=A0A1M8A1J7_MALS4|nr:Subunit F of the V1 peripheral membrane domain of V-ATPase [Malassezia sympodialis ATCC 42132]
MSSLQQAGGRSLIALIADEDSTTGFILAGIGDVNKEGDKNFFVVDNKTATGDIEEAFSRFTKERDDIAIVLINQHIADKIRPLVDKYNQAFPALLEIPSKDHPYDPTKDGVLKRVQKIFGE